LSRTVWGSVLTAVAPTTMAPTAVALAAMVLMGTSMAACQRTPPTTDGPGEGPTREIHRAAMVELFTVRERAQRLVFWRDPGTRGPVFSRLHADGSSAALPEPVAAAATGDLLPIDSVSLPRLEQLFRDAPDGWKAFFAQQPGAPGIIELGEVRHDSRSGTASVLVGRSCGERCATAWQLELRRAPEWQVTAMRVLSLPPESPHVRFARAETMRHAALDGFTILDARGRWAYGRGHVPGAVRVDWKDYRDGWGRTGAPVH
jgi:hypothetical protein